MERFVELQHAKGSIRQENAFFHFLDQFVNDLSIPGVDTSKAYKYRRHQSQNQAFCLPLMGIELRGCSFLHGYRMNRSYLSIDNVYSTKLAKMSPVHLTLHFISECASDPSFMKMHAFYDQMGSLGVYEVFVYKGDQRQSVTIQTADAKCIQSMLVQHVNPIIAAFSHLIEQKRADILTEVRSLAVELDQLFPPNTKDKIACYRSLFHAFQQAEDHANALHPLFFSTQATFYSAILQKAEKYASVLMPSAIATENIAHSQSEAQLSQISVGAFSEKSEGDECTEQAKLCEFLDIFQSGCPDAACVLAQYERLADVSDFLLIHEFDNYRRGVTREQMAPLLKSFKNRPPAVSTFFDFLQAGDVTSAEAMLTFVGDQLTIREVGDFLLQFDASEEKIQAVLAFLARICRAYCHILNGSVHDTLTIAPQQVVTVSMIARLAWHNEKIFRAMVANGAVLDKPMLARGNQSIGILTFLVDINKPHLISLVQTYVDVGQPFVQKVSEWFSNDERKIGALMSAGFCKSISDDPCAPWFFSEELRMIRKASVLVYAAFILRWQFMQELLESFSMEAFMLQEIVFAYALLVRIGGSLIQESGKYSKICFQLKPECGDCLALTMHKYIQEHLEKATGEEVIKLSKYFHVLLNSGRGGHSSKHLVYAASLATLLIYTFRADCIDDKLYFSAYAEWLLSYAVSDKQKNPFPWAHAMHFYQQHEDLHNDPACQARHQACSKYIEKTAEEMRRAPKV